MKRKTAIVLAGAGCLLLAVFIWLLWAEGHHAANVNVESGSESNGASVAPGALSPLITLEPESVQPAKRTEKDETVSNENSDKKYHFVTWHDALDEFLRRFRIEFDKLAPEGHPYPEIIAVQACRNIDILSDPELSEAMKPFVPFFEPLSDDLKNRVPNPNPGDRIPMKIWGNPIRIGILAGRLPEDSIYRKAYLSIGKVLYLEEFQQARVTWATRRPPRIETEQGQRDLETLRQRKRSLESVLETAQGEAFDQAFKELERIKGAVWALHQPGYTYHKAIVGAPDSISDHPEFERIEMDLGVIERERGMPHIEE